ncbi:MAG: hypothetical protein OXN21_05460, partial [Chloroflexota bacterium]|nr:hypothetical protein [Chloroflexota bacterium]
ARTLDRRAQSIMFWLGMSEEDQLPPEEEILARLEEQLGGIPEGKRPQLMAPMIDLVKGGLSQASPLMGCYMDLQADEYLLGSGPGLVTVLVQTFIPAHSWEFYTEVIKGGRPIEGGETREVHQRRQQELLMDIRLSMADVVGGRESVLFIAPLADQGNVAVEVWQVLALWDLQDGPEPGLVQAVRYDTYDGDPEYRQPLDELRKRIVAAAEASSADRLKDVRDLNTHYHELGAYDDITPGDGLDDPFTPALPPPPTP